MQGYRSFLVYLRKHGQNKITFNERMHEEMIEQDKRTHKRTGFPCHLISLQWLDDYNSMRNSSSTTNYLGPVTNFAICNDIFEAQQYGNPLHQHKNAYFFPIPRYKLISKKLWTFFCSLFAGDNQFAPIKRLYRERASYYENNPEIVDLVPAVIICGKELTLYQLTANELVSRELLPLLEKRHGLGELKLLSDLESSFEYFYSG